MRRLILSAVLSATVAGCASAPAPAPIPLPRPVPVAPPAPRPVPLTSDWRDWPATPGNWRYSGRVASFGAPGGALLTLGCEGGSITLTRAVSATSATIRTSSLTRAVALQPSAGGAAARLPATDPLLDAIGYSRGRFVVESAGTPPLVVPAWAEVLRIVEDCRG
jgi:hypothetical protein